MSRRGSVLATVLAIGFVARPGSASASEGVPVVFSFEGCDESLSPQVERIARIELHAAPALNRDRDAVTRIGVACADNDVQLAVDDPITGKRVERTVSLAAIAPEGHGRLLALAIAELVRSSWLEVEITPAPVLAPASVPTVSVEQKQRALEVALERKQRPLWAFAAIDGLYIPTVGTPLLGLALGAHGELRRPPVHPLFVEGTLSGWDGATSRSSGLITIRQLAFDGTLGLHASVVDLALGLRVGWTTLAGSPSASRLRGDSVSGIFVGPLLTARVRIVGPLEVGVRTGWLLHGERGTVSGDSDVTVGGYWASLAVGVRIGS